MFVRLGGPTLLVLACLILPGAVLGADSALMAERLRSLKALQREQLLREPSEKLERFREWHQRAKQAGNRLRPRPKAPGGDLGAARKLRAVSRPVSHPPQAG